MLCLVNANIRTSCSNWCRNYFDLYTCTVHTYHYIIWWIFCHSNEVRHNFPIAKGKMTKEENYTPESLPQIFCKVFAMISQNQHISYVESLRIELRVCCQRCQAITNNLDWWFHGTCALRFFANKLNNLWTLLIITKEKKSPIHLLKSTSILFGVSSLVFWGVARQKINVQTSVRWIEWCLNHTITDKLLRIIR